MKQNSNKQLPSLDDWGQIIDRMQTFGSTSGGGCRSRGLASIAPATGFRLAAPAMMRQTQHLNIDLAAIEQAPEERVGTVAAVYFPALQRSDVHFEQSCCSMLSEPEASANLP